MAVKTVQPTQTRELVNEAVSQITGVTAVITDDYTGVYDMGIQLENANAYRNFVYSLNLAIGRKIFVNRPYKAKVPNIMRTNDEWGQITTKTRSELPDAMDNQSWQLTNNTSYDDNVFIADDVETTLFIQDTAYEIRKSITDKQIKGAFQNIDELNKFVAMLMQKVQDALEVQEESLVKGMINNFTAEVITENKSTRYVKLLSKFKEIHTDSTLTSETCRTDKEFLRFMGSEMSKYSGYLETLSVLFNDGKFKTHTPKSLQHFVMLDDISSNLSTYLSSDTFHDEFVKLPYHETVTCWQGTGTSLAFKDLSSINVKTSNGNTVEKSYIVAVLFDHDALGIRKDEPYTNAKRVESADFTNYWFKEHVAYFSDLHENYVVFTLE